MTIFRTQGVTSLRMKALTAIRLILKGLARVIGKRRQFSECAW